MIRTINRVRTLNRTQNTIQQTRTKRTSPAVKETILPDIVIPSQVFFNKNISSNGKILLGVLNHLTDNETNYCDLSNRYLGKILGVKPDTITKLVSKLSKAKLIRTKYIQDFNGKDIRQIFLMGSINRGGL